MKLEKIFREYLSKFKIGLLISTENEKNYCKHYYIKS